jgi:hypothetical protein
VFELIRRDLDEDGNLEPAFKQCQYCTSLPARMAVNLSKAGGMFRIHEEKYKASIMTDLVFRDISEIPQLSFSADKSELDLSMEGNELLVIEAW